MILLIYTFQNLRWDLYTELSHLAMCWSIWHVHFQHFGSCDESGAKWDSHKSKNYVKA